MTSRLAPRSNTGFAARPPETGRKHDLPACRQFDRRREIQTGGNGIQFWGVNGQSADIRFIEVDNAEGYALFDGGMNQGRA